MKTTSGSTAPLNLDDARWILGHDVAPSRRDEPFDEHEILGLAEPVRRYFQTALRPGAPMARAAELAMLGSLKLNGRWLPLRAHEVLAPHEGFVWRARVAGVISGSDRCVAGHGAMRWKLLGLVPVVDAHGPDIARSSAGRAVAEAVWVPSSLLPRFGVEWTARSDRDITARLGFGDLDFELHLRLDDGGLVEAAWLDRWGDPDQTGDWALHRFGMTTTSNVSFGDLTVPASVRVGWFPESDRWPAGEFIRCELTRLDPLATAHLEAHDRAPHAAEAADVTEA